MHVLTRHRARDTRGAAGVKVGNVVQINTGGVGRSQGTLLKELLH